jgi:hypothetical protein
MLYPADSHTSAASSRLIWLPSPPHQFKWTRPFRQKREIWFLRVCHHILTCLYLQCVFLIRTCRFTHSSLLPENAASCHTWRESMAMIQSFRRGSIDFQRVCGHHHLPTYFLISFRVVYLRNDCSVTNRAQLARWERNFWMKSDKLTAWKCDVVSTTWNRATRYTWLRMTVASSAWCIVNFFFQHETKYVSYQQCHV